MVTTTVYPIPKGWRVCCADDIKSPKPHSCVAGPFGSKISSKYFVDEGVPVIRGSNLRDDLTRFVSDSFVFVSEAKAQEYRPQHVRAGDLVFTCWGTIGQVGLVPEDGPYPEYIISNKQLKLRIDLTVADPVFCFYYFASPRYAEYIRNRGIGGAVPGINLGILKSLPIALPPLQVQKKIADTLSAYDDLIENNQRRMELLEEAARQLYSEWFVRLRFPGREHTPISNGVPEGWEQRPIGEVALFNYGKALKKDDRADGEIPVYGSSGVIGTHDKPCVNGSGIIVGRKGNVGSVFWSDRPFWAIDTVYFVSSEQSSLYLFHCLQHVPFQSSDVAVPGLNRTYAHSLKILFPKQIIRNQFEENVTPMFEQISKLQFMNEKLRTARDLLLPRLMSGEIPV